MDKSGPANFMNMMQQKPATHTNDAGQTLYSMCGFPQDEPFKKKTVEQAAGQYVICTTAAARRDTTAGEDRRVAANGIYLFVVRPEEPSVCYVRRAPDDLNVGTHVTSMRGHSSIAEQGPVLFAGELYFDNGALNKWTNKTGHYFCGGQFGNDKGKLQAHVGEQLAKLVTPLPLNKFEPVKPKEFIQ